MGDQEEEFFALECIYGEDIKSKNIIELITC